MKVVYHKEVDINCCADCPYCSLNRTMEGLLAFCMKMKELGCEPYENLIGGYGHTIYQCIDHRCPIKKEEK